MLTLGYEWFWGVCRFQGPWPFQPLTPQPPKKDSESKRPADCPFALSLRSKPKGPVITVLLSWRPYIPTVSLSTQQYVWHHQAVYLVWPPPTVLQILLCWIAQHFTLTLIYSDKFCRQSRQLDGFLWLMCCLTVCVTLSSYRFKTNVSCRKAENVDRRKLCRICLHYAYLP